MNTQLTTINPSQSGPLAMPGHFELEGFEDLGQGDIILPRWSIIQPTSKKPGADDHVGQFQRNIDGEFRPHLDVVLLKVSPTRLLWSGDTSDTRPECFSRDAVNGSAYGVCAQCQFNVQVNPALRDQSDAKICNFGYTLLTVDDVEAGTMALIGAMGTSVRPVKVLTTQFVQRKRPAFSAVVRLEVERVTNEKGKFYVLKPSIREWLDQERMAPWRELFLSLKGATIRDIDEDDAGEDGSEAPPF